ncbi:MULTISPECIES: hypothetical protein [Streptomyces]|uniref:hypothetical protein n=1 Tax=Streptomyces TaxID=1883 RepID=UPI001FECE457|nr:MULTISPECIES: hypothetical protein [Streptomyces]
MARRTSRGRRLVAGDRTFTWSVRHSHTRREDGRCDCRESLTLVHGRDRRAVLRIVFRNGPGRWVPDGLAPSGSVGTSREEWLNLHEPGAVRALLDAALAAGWDPAAPTVTEVDGWTLLPAAAAARGLPPSRHLPPASQQVSARDVP